MITKRRQKKTIKQQTKKIYLYCFLLIVGIAIIIFNDFGLIRLIQLNNTHKELQKSINTLTTQQIKLNEEITELKTNTDYIEKLAREKFMMVKPGEKVFRVVDYKKTKN